MPTGTCPHHCPPDHSGGGLALAVVVALVLLGSSGAVASAVHALLVAVIAVAIGLAVLAAAVVTVAILVRRRRLARFLAEPLAPPPWRPVVAARPARAALPPGSPAARRAALQLPRQLPARTVIPGQVEPDDRPRTGGRRHARREP